MKSKFTKNSLATLFLCIAIATLAGCATVPMAPKEQDAASKTFSSPPADKSALYIYRDSFVGKALKKLVSIDGKPIGQTANLVYFYEEITPGNHTLSTESEFGDNTLTFEAEAGKTYFAHQYIKMGVFIGGSGIEMVDEEQGKKEVLQCQRGLAYDPSAGATAGK